MVDLKIKTEFESGVGNEFKKIIWLDDDLLFLTAAGGRPGVWDLKQNNLLFQIADTTYFGKSSDAGGKIVASCIADYDEDKDEYMGSAQLRVYEIPSGSLRATIEIQTDSEFSMVCEEGLPVAVSRNGSQIAVWRDSASITLYSSIDLSVQQEIEYELECCDDSHELHFLPNNKLIAFGDEVLIFDSNTGELLLKPDGMRPFTEYPSLRSILLWDDKLEAFRLSDGVKIREFDELKKSDYQRVWSLACSPDCKYLAAVTSLQYGQAWVRLWRFPEFKLLWSKLGEDFTIDHPMHVSFSPDSSTLAVGYCSGYVRLWDVEGRENDFSESDVSKTTNDKGTDVYSLRGCETIGGKFEYKIKVKNDSDYVITNVCFQVVAYPENLQLSGNASETQTRIDPKKFGAQSYILLPTHDCVEGDIQATVSYLDHHNKLHVIPVEPYTIRSVCDLLKPLDVALDQFDELISKLDKTSAEMVIDWNPEALFQRLLTVIQLKNFRIIDSQMHKIGIQFVGTLKGLAKGKYTEKKVAVIVLINGHVDGQQSSVTIEVIGEDEAMLPVTVHELRTELKPLKDLMDNVRDDSTKILEAIGNLEEDVAELGRQAVAASINAMEYFESSSQPQQETFEQLLNSIERLMEKLGEPKSRIDRVKDALNSGLKSGLKEVGKIALKELLRIFVGV